ncbi:MAG: NUDIX domain-containing protein [Candidatus Pacearchaeota archaeon]
MERKILNLFLFNNKLKFSEIERLLKIRSNKLSYHIKQLINKGVLTKKQEEYFLSEASEYLLPYISNKTSALPVILIHIGEKNKSFLYKREKRPFKNFLSLPGGRLLIRESIQEAANRIMKEKFNINVKFKKVNSISLEQVRKSNKTIHSFLLILVSVTTKDNISLTNINKNKSKIIKSDYYLLKNNLDKQIKIEIIKNNSS